MRRVLFAALMLVTSCCSLFASSPIKEGHMISGHVIEKETALGGEDFAYYVMEKPGAFFHVGMADPERPITSTPHHNCHFQLDERGLRIALECELATYLKATGQM